MISRIKTKEEISKQKKKKKLIGGLLLATLMIVSSIGFSFLSSDSTSNQEIRIKENGLEFTRQNYYWITNLDNQEYYLQYLPSQVSDISLEGTYSLQDYSNKEVYFVNSNEATSEILVNLGRYTSRYQDACLENFPCKSDAPNKTCEDNLIIFEEANETKVYKDNNCVYITGDHLKASDAFIYKLLNII